MSKDMNNKIIQIDEHLVQSKLTEIVKGTVEQTLNGLLDAEADRLCKADRYGRTEARTDTRAGHYKILLTVAGGSVYHASTVVDTTFWFFIHASFPICFIFR